MPSLTHSLLLLHRLSINGNGQGRRRGLADFTPIICAQPQSILKETCSASSVPQSKVLHTADCRACWHSDQPSWALFYVYETDTIKYYTLQASQGVICEQARLNDASGNIQAYLHCGLYANVRRPLLVNQETWCKAVCTHCQHDMSSARLEDRDGAGQCVHTAIQHGPSPNSNLKALPECSKSHTCVDKCLRPLSTRLHESSILLSTPACVVVHLSNLL